MKGEAPLSSSASHGPSDGEHLLEDGGRVDLLAGLRSIAPLSDGGVIPIARILHYSRSVGGLDSIRRPHFGPIL